MTAFVSHGDLSPLFHFRGSSQLRWESQTSLTTAPAWGCVPPLQPEANWPLLGDWAQPNTLVRETQGSLALLAVLIVRIKMLSPPLSALDVSVKSAQGTFHLKIHWLLRGRFPAQFWTQISHKAVPSKWTKGCRLWGWQFSLGLYPPQRLCCTAKSRDLGSAVTWMSPHFQPTTARQKKQGNILLPSVSTKDTASLYPCWKTS